GVCTRPAFLFVVTCCRPPASPLFPYTTLFRSARGEPVGREQVLDGQVDHGHAAGQRQQRLRLLEIGVDVARIEVAHAQFEDAGEDRKSTRLNSSHVKISYAVFCLKKKKNSTYT